MSMLLGAAKILKAREAELKGSVLLVFQPAEEGGAGARRGQGGAPEAREQDSQGARGLGHARRVAGGLACVAACSARRPLASEWRAHPSPRTPQPHPPPAP
jgi:hypothetical protein